MAKVYGTATQGAADAFVQGSIVTALQGQTTQAFRIREIEFEVEGAVWMPRIAADCEFELCLTRRSKTAMPDIDDVDIIKKWKYFSAGATAVGQFTSPEPQVYIPNLELIIVEDPIYIQLDSTATGQTYTVTVAVDYEIVNISDIDRLTLLTQSLV